MADLQADPRRATAIEQTSKVYKLQQLLSVLLIILGVVLVFAGAGSDSSAITGLGILLFVAGFVWYVVARVLAWWHHG